MKLVSQTQKDDTVQKIRNENIEKRAKKKVSKTRLSESLLAECTITNEKKIQKDLFKSHRKTLKKIWTIGRGLIFAQHFSELTGMKKAEMYRELHFLEKAGLLNIGCFCTTPLFRINCTRYGC